MQLIHFIAVGIALTQLSCSGNTSIRPLCGATQRRNLNKALNVQSSIDRLFLPSWNGLSGVLVGKGQTPDEPPVNAICKVYLETVPDREKKNGAKTYLWSQENCQARGLRQLYLAFASGYLMVEFKAKSSVLNPKTMSETASEKTRFVQQKILDHPWTISEDYKKFYGPPSFIEPTAEPGQLISSAADKTYSFNPYGHVIEEIEILPSTSEITNEFIALVIQKQLERRAQLIPQNLEPHLEVFRDFFLEKNIIKRLLVDFSQSNNESTGYRYCPNEQTAQECNLDQETFSNSLRQTLSSELWNEVKDYFHPVNQLIPNYASHYNAQFSSLNDAIRSLFQTDKLQVRIPMKNPEDLPLIQRGFNDQRFTLLQTSDYAQQTNPLRYSEPTLEMPHVLLRELQEETFCSDPSYPELAPVTSEQSVEGYSKSFSIGSGGAMIGWGGMIPFATKRPRQVVCFSIPPTSSGGTSITPLPEIALSEDEMIQESELQAYVQDQNAEIQSENQPSPAESLEPTVSSQSEQSSCMFVR